MPNGRTGGFYIKKDDLEQLLRGIPGDTVVGKNRDATATASEVIALLAKHRKDEVPIEEQDHFWYIAHLRDWISISQSSPLYGSLRRYHHEWMREWLREREER
jgi:hypothetical protein